MFQSDPALNPGPHTNRLTHTGKHSPALVDNLGEEGKKKKSKTDGMKPWQALVPAQQRTEDIQSSCELRRQSDASNFRHRGLRTRRKVTGAEDGGGKVAKGTQQQQQLCPARTRRSMKPKKKVVPLWLRHKLGAKRRTKWMWERGTRACAGVWEGQKEERFVFPGQKKLDRVQHRSVASSCISSRGFTDHGRLLETPYLMRLVWLFLALMNAGAVDNNKLKVEVHRQTRLTSRSCPAGVKISTQWAICDALKRTFWQQMFL